MTQVIMRPISPLQAKRAGSAFLAHLTQGRKNVLAFREGALAFSSPEDRDLFYAAIEAALAAAMVFRVPFTPDEVEALNTFQIADFMHPFTCPNDHGFRDRRLKATLEGWICPHCTYTQDWAHGFMLETWVGEPMKATNVVPLRP